MHGCFNSWTLLCEAIANVWISKSQTLNGMWLLCTHVFPLCHWYCHGFGFKCYFLYGFEFPSYIPVFITFCVIGLYPSEFLVWNFLFHSSFFIVLPLVCYFHYVCPALIGLTCVLLTLPSLWIQDCVFPFSLPACCVPWCAFVPAFSLIFCLWILPLPFRTLFARLPLWYVCSPFPDKSLSSAYGVCIWVQPLLPSVFGINRDRQSKYVKTYVVSQMSYPPPAWWMQAPPLNQTKWSTFGRGHGMNDEFVIWRTCWDTPNYRAETLQNSLKNGVLYWCVACISNTM